ncbi:MAG: response regulator [Gemmatimonadetes bacterium]|nr:response regulator [Gemmatimonadota bacterium]
MPSFSVLEMQEKTPDDFRRWAIGGSLVGAIAYTIVAVTVLSIRGTDAALPIYSPIAAAIGCWVAFGLVLRGESRAGTLLTVAACWTESTGALSTSPLFPSPGLLAGPVLVMGASLLLGRRIGLILTLVSVAITAPLVRISPEFIDTGLSVRAWYWLVIHAVGMLAAWGVVAISLRTLQRTVMLVRDQERELSELIAFAPDGILILTPADHVHTANAAAGRLLGLTGGDAAGRSLSQLLGAAGWQSRAADLGELSRPMTTPLLWTLVRAGEPASHVEVTWRRIDAGRRQLMLRDVTERVRTERTQRDNQSQLAHSQRLEAIGQLAGGIAHDFNNLLMAISGSAELLRDEADAEMRATLLDEVLAAQERGASLTRQLLAFARRDVARPTVLDLSALVTQRQRLLQPIVGDRVKLILDLEPDARVSIDAAQMEQVLVNLVANARDAMPGGGRCVLSVQRVTGPTGPEQVRMRVSDEGVGMDEETVARAFEPFFTTKARGHGTGLGLASVQGIIMQSGGTVALASVPAQGTTVEILLPFATEALETGPVSLAPEEARRAAGATILVVDDDDSTRTVVARILQRAGYAVRLAPDGIQALRVLDADPRGIDMLVSDVTMPGLTGPELADAVQLRVPGLPMLFISGYPKDVVSAESGLRAEHDLLTKPFTARELTDRVAERLAVAREAAVEDGSPT